MKLTMQEARELMEKDDGSLNLREREDITGLPENLSVGGKVILDGSGIKNQKKRGT